MLVTSHPPVYLGVEHICSKKTSTSHRRGASAARKAHNLEVTGSTPVAGIISLRSFYRIEPSSWTLNVALHSFTRRCSSAEERLTPSPSFSTPFRGGPIWGWLSAHNREVVGSKPTIGISIPLHYFTPCSSEAERRKHRLLPFDFPHSPMFVVGTT